MKSKSPPRMLLALGVALLMAVTLVPMQAQAQGAGQADASFTIQTITPPAPIQPDIGTATITVPWVYNIDTSGGQLVGAQTTSTTLVWDPPSCDNNNVIITGSLSETITLFEGTQPKQRTEGSSNFNVQVTSDAPGEQPIRCTISGRVEQVAGVVSQAGPANGQVNVQAQYLGLLSANIPSTIKQAGPQKQIRYDIELSNLGNSRSTIKFDLAAESEGGWQPVPPTQIVLESPAQGGEETTKTVGFLVSTPFKNGWNNKETTFQLQITPTSTKDPNIVGQEITVNLLARVRGVYVPSLEPLVLLGAVIGSALLVRRMRDDE